MGSNPEIQRRGNGFQSDELILGKTDADSRALTYHVLPAGALSEQFPEWKALKSIGVAISYRIENMEKFSMEYRYYIKLG